ncbi:MAG: RusA family crossover junction endodeoxyribonuclease [Rhodospirillales bacterium]
MADDHGWTGSRRFRVARLDDALIVRFGAISTQAGRMKRAIGDFFRKEYRRYRALHSPFAVSIWIEQPKNGRRLDCDNVAKACLDALTGVLWIDDSQVVRLVVEKVQSDSESITLMAVPHVPSGPSSALEELLERLDRS